MNARVLPCSPMLISHWYNEEFIYATVPWSLFQITRILTLRSNVLNWLAILCLTKFTFSCKKTVKMTTPFNGRI